MSFAHLDLLHSYIMQHSRIKIYVNHNNKSINAYIPSAKSSPAVRGSWVRKLDWLRKP